MMQEEDRFTGVSTQHDLNRHRHHSVDLPLGGDGQVMGTGVFASSDDGRRQVLKVQRRFAGVSTQHDQNRHGHHLSVSLPLGGDGKLMGTELYYTLVKIGSPLRDFYVCVDTGSNLFSLKCNKKALYYPSKSQTSTLIPCGHHLCPRICDSGSPCEYHMAYGDQRSSTGYLVTDQVQLDAVSGIFSTKPVNQTSYLANGSGRDGIVGFGRSNVSLISQLADSGLVKKSFPHCLDADNGGGIYILGQVDYPKVNTTSLTKNSAEVEFPSVTLHFQGSLKFVVHPHAYLISYELFTYCIGWRSSRLLADWAVNFALLGDMVISNKFITYDLENETIGWKEYDCFSSVGVKDENSSSVYEADPHLIWDPPMIILPLLV